MGNGARQRRRLRRWRKKNPTYRDIRMRELRNKRREAVFIRCNGKCVWCSTPFAHAFDKNITHDHIVPNSKQGSRWWENLLLSCRLCNNRRGNLGARAWIKVCKLKGMNIQETLVRQAIADASSNPRCYKKGYRVWITQFRFGLVEIDFPNPLREPEKPATIKA